MIINLGGWAIVAVIIAACVALSKSKGGALGCTIAAIVVAGLLIHTCVDMQREEEEKKEWNKKFQERLRKKDEVWREYSKTLPENYYDRQEYLKSGKDAEAREKRDRALEEIDREYDL